MKTSYSQFEMMVTFMEQHGDLSKPLNLARGRTMAMLRWEELVSLLNSDASGDTKTIDRWKKAWSDLKNNTKKKAARIHRAATGTGGGPALHTKLSELEKRVLDLVGVEAATGLDIEEAGVLQPQVVLEETPLGTIPEPTASTSQVVHEASSVLWTVPSPTSPTQHHAVSPSYMHVTEEVIIENQVTPTRPTTVVTPQLLPQPQPHVAEPLLQPSSAGLATPRRGRRVARPQRSPRRRVRPAHQEAEHFLRSDQEWRNFRKQQHQELMQAKAEENRLRELDIQERNRSKEIDIEVHNMWKSVALRALDILDKFANK